MHTVSANGANIPAIGFGTWTLKGDDATRLVKGAIADGYRHIDTAAMYDNEEAVGRGIAASGLKRDDLFVTTKVWHTDLAADDFRASAEASVKRLGLDHVDLLLIHWPSSTSVPLDETLKVLNQVRADGLTRHIGVSNFPTVLVEEANSLSDAPIACNQVEYHPYLNQDKVIAANRAHGMATVSYCPLNRAGDLFEQPIIASAAERTGKTPAQIVLRWHVQQPDVIAIPRSTNPERIRQNIDVFDFELSDDEMAGINALRSRNHRICDFDFSPAWD